jgi:hypothetical protein
MRLPFALCCLLAASQATCARAASDTPPPNVVRVTGTAQVTTTPDRFTVILGADSEAPDPEATMKRNDEQVKALFEVFREAGLLDSQVVTADFSLEPALEYSQFDRPKLTGYRVRKTFVVTMERLPDLEKVMARALEKGAANRVESVSYATSQLRKHRDRARSLAVALAKEKALALAEQAGRQLGPIITITELEGDSYSWDRRYRPGRQAGIDELSPDALAQELTISRGSIAVTASLQLDFALE